MNIAFLIIDVQKAYIGNRKGQQPYEDALEYINATSNLFRNYDKPVFVIRHIEDGDNENYQVVDELIINETDHGVTKIYNNSFYQTDLEEKLKNLNIDTVVLSGNALEFCVTASFFGAKERGFNVFLLENGIIAEFDDNLKNIGQYRPLISYYALKYMLSESTQK